MFLFIKVLWQILISMLRNEPFINIFDFFFSNIQYRSGITGTIMGYYSRKYQDWHDDSICSDFHYCSIGQQPWLVGGVEEILSIYQRHKPLHCEHGRCRSAFNCHTNAVPSGLSLPFKQLDWRNSGDNNLQGFVLPHPSFDSSDCPNNDAYFIR